MTREQSGTPSSAAAAGRALRYLSDDKLKVPLSTVNSTAMQTLFGAVKRAGSLDEIEIIVRYQQAREQRGWPKDLIEQIILDMRAVAESARDEKGKVDAAAQQLGLIARIHKVVEKSDRGHR